MELYATETWHELFIMAGGAAAAFAGLIFVAVSLNTEVILKIKALPPLALRTLFMLIGIVILSAFGLAPGQPAAAFGVEMLGLGLFLATFVVISVVRGWSETERISWRAAHIIVPLLAVIPYLVGGVSLLAGAGGGMIWALAAIVAGIAFGTYYAWILLIEIRR